MWEVIRKTVRKNFPPPSFQKRIWPDPLNALLWLHDIFVYNYANWMFGKKYRAFQGLVIAGIADYTRPAEKLSVSQSLL